MFWLLIALFGGGSFVITGLGVLFDPDCDTVSFSGSRAITATCYPDYAGMTGDFPGWLAGIGMVLAGFLIVWIGFRAWARG